MNPLRDQDFKCLFEGAPSKILVLRPVSLEIVAVTDAYLQATLTRRSDIVGKTLFDVFPDNSGDPQADGVLNLSASLRRVQALKTLDIMGIQRYPIRLPNGVFEDRFWSPVNSPVLDEASEIAFIMHRVEDVTALVRQGAASAGAEAGGAGEPDAVQDIVLRSQELRQALSRLQEHEVRQRTAARMLQLGTWEYHPGTGGLNWSGQAFEIHGFPADRQVPDLEAYLAFVHPDDREASRAAYAAVDHNNAGRIEFEHRVIDRNGQVRYIRGAGERRASHEGGVVVGYVQNVTALVRTRDKLSQAEQLLQLAGQKARLGGWRVEIDSGAVVWTPETAVIHGMPAGHSPASASEAIQYYAPEHRALIQAAFERCVRDGEEFDVVCQLHARDGRRPWVRAMGVAERLPDGRICAVQGAFQDISVLHEAQARADEAERQRLDVFEKISDAFFALDAGWNFTYMNQQAGVLLERPRDSLLGRNVWSEFPEAVGSEFHRQYQQAAESRQTSRFQAFYPPLDKWFDVSAYPIHDGLAVYFRDVTRDRQRQEELRLIDAALSRQNDIVMITEADILDAPDGPRIVYVNDAFERLTGYTRSEVIGRTPRLLQGPDSDRKQLERIRNALRNRQPVRGEVLNYSKSGACYWLDIDITPLFDDSGHCTHFVAVERDVTERKQHEAAVRQAKDRFDLISRATNDVIWDWDLVANKVWWNESMTDVFGYPVRQLEPGPESWTNRIHPDDRERIAHSIHEVIDGSGELWSGEYRFARSDGKSAKVIDRGFVIRDDAGKAIRMVGSMLDITARQDMEQRLRESQKLEAVGHLTGGVAHDFNNLLTVIVGNSEMFTEMLTEPRLRSMAEMTLFAALRGAELTSRLLAFARRQPLKPKPTDLNQRVESMKGLVRRTLPENIALEIVADPGLGITEIDAGELDTALLNLVVNARDAMQDGGKLTIETANAVLENDDSAHHFDVTPGEYVMICVSDTGSGMDRDTVSRAVEPFFTTKPMGKGSGLGLSMVYGFTKQSGGRIRIYSEPGEGTAVRLYFPRVLAALPPVVEAAAAVPLQGGTEHILIAEDDELVLRHLESQLGLLGYRVTAARSGAGALDRLQVHSDVDLLITDVVMPGGMNGRELADRVKTIRPRLKVLFTSGYTENTIVHHGRLDKGVDLLSKPYTRQELASKVRLVLDRTQR